MAKKKIDFKSIIKNNFISEPNPEPNKTKDAIILVIGLVIMVLMVILIRNTNSKKYSKPNNTNNNVQEEVKVDETVNDKKNELEVLFNKYVNYKYKITVLDESNSYTYFEGSLLNNENNGIKTKDVKKIKYKITDQGAINVVTSEEITDLYQGLLYYLFEPKNVYDLIKDVEINKNIVDNTTTYNYDILYNDQRILIKLLVSNEEINQIYYEYNNIKYTIDLSLDLNN